jgi:hypothetical protein
MTATTPQSRKKILAPSTTTQQKNISPAYQASFD